MWLTTGANPYPSPPPLAGIPGNGGKQVMVPATGEGAALFRYLNDDTNGCLAGVMRGVWFAQAVGRCASPATSQREGKWPEAGFGMTLAGYGLADVDEAQGGRG
jgi:hypothetical protein